MKKELLVPVKNMECLRAAIFNGCDAVYLGGKRFGARAYADNFTHEELMEAIRFSHFFDVKVYVTVNTMVMESEMQEVQDYLRFLLEQGVDAVIISDMGLIYWIHETIPQLPIHVSTQAHTFSVSQIQFLKTLGVARVVLDREMSLKEISSLPDIMEYEVFVHGALCVSYSGCCLMSAMNEGRSGNRGTCAQYCRMKYKILKNGKLLSEGGDYPLSTKDLYTLRHLSELMNSKIASFKIEGRMKSKEYVALMTRCYRKYMDSIDKKISLQEEENIYKIFNREFTKGYLFEEENIYNEKTPNHLGISIGNVIAINEKKIKILLTHDLAQFDGIRFGTTEYGQIINFLYDENGLLIHSARKGDIVLIENKFGLKEKLEVRKTVDKVLNDELCSFPERKIPITMKGTFTLKNCSLRISDKTHEVVVESSFAERAISRSTSKEEIEKNLKKLGGTFYVLEHIDIEVEDHLFLVVSKLNELRRTGIDLLTKEREGNYEN